MVSRPARPVADEIRARADAAGVTLSDYISHALAHHCGMPEHAPALRQDQELPMTG